MTQGLWELHRYPDMHAHKLKSADLYKLKEKILSWVMAVKHYGLHPRLLGQLMKCNLQKNICWLLYFSEAVEQNY